MGRKYEIFISHAGEDKDTLADPIYQELEGSGIRSFLDRSELRVGEKAIPEMIEAMETTRIGVFILSPEFPAKKWTMEELFCFEKRLQAAKASGAGSSDVPVLVPVFYRLSVADCRYGNVFRNHVIDGALTDDFMERIERGETSRKKVLDSLASLTAIMGIENEENATNELSDAQETARENLAKRVCKHLKDIVWNTRREVEDSEGDGNARTEDWYHPTFYAPENAAEVVLEFANPDRPEGQVLRKVCADSGTDRKVKVIAIKGGAGVGKSCILRALARREDVKRRFPGGVYYMLLGMDAVESTFVSEVIKVVRMSGGKQLSKALRDENSTDIILQEAGSWLCGKKCLLLLDDVWEHNGIGAGQVARVSRMLSEGTSSMLILSTRFSSISAKRERVVVAPRKAFSTEAKHMLLSYADFTDKEVESKPVSEVVEAMLQKCGGLPAALAVTGRGVGQLAQQLEPYREEAWTTYWSMMKSSEDALVQADIDEYRGLGTTLSVSLRIAEVSWSRGVRCELRYSLEEMHRSLCIFPKQVTVPLITLQGLWKLKSHADVLLVLLAFANVGLAEITIEAEKREKRLRLHDLIHDFAGLCARHAEGCSVWHSRVLSGYMGQTVETMQLRPWWDIVGDGYIVSNLSRHLVEGGCLPELISLLLTGMWTLRCCERSSLSAWRADFLRCLTEMDNSKSALQDEREALRLGLRFIRDVVSESWHFISKNPKELCFQVHARLGGLDKGVCSVKSYLESIRHCQLRPWLEPVRRYYELPGRGRMRAEVRVHNVVQDVAVYGSLRFVVAAVGTEVLFVDMEELQVRFRCRGHTDVVKKIAICASGDLIASASKDRTVRVWLSATGEQLPGSLGHQDTEITSVAISANGRFVASGCGDATVRVWDVPKRAQIWQRQAHKGPVRCVRFHPHRGLLATGCDRGELRLWDPTEDQVRFMAGVTGHLIRVWDVQAKVDIGKSCQAHVGDATCLSFSPDGQCFVSGSSDSTLLVWDTVQGTEMGKPFRGHGESVTSVSFNVDGRTFVSGSSDCTLRLWDMAATDEEEEVLSARKAVVSIVAISPDGSRAVSASKDQTIRVWNTMTGIQIWEAPDAGTRSVECLAFTADGKCIASGDAVGTIRFWDAATGTSVGNSILSYSDNWDPIGVACIAFSADGEHLASASVHSKILVWNVEKGTQVGKEVHRDWKWHSVGCLALSPDGKRLVVGSCEGTLWVRDVSTSSLIGEVHQASVTPARIHISHDLHVFSYDQSGRFDVFKLDALHGLVRARTQEVQFEAQASSTSAQPRYTVSCSGRDVKSTVDGEVLATLPDEIVREAWQYDPDHGLLVAGLRNGQVLCLRLVT